MITSATAARAGVALLAASAACGSPRDVGLQTGFLGREGSTYMYIACYVDFALHITDG